MPENKLVQCRKPFVTVLDGRRVRAAVGDVYDANDPIVKGREALFGEIDVKSSRPAATRTQETATAGPGERRSVTRPQPKAEPKSKEDKPDA